MAEFVMFATVQGRAELVNPDRVARIRLTQQGMVSLVFGAIAGGLDELVVVGKPAEVLARLSAPKPEAQSAPLPLTRDEVSAALDDALLGLPKKTPRTRKSA